jgi:hypothetical protein
VADGRWARNLCFAGVFAVLAATPALASDETLNRASALLHTGHPQDAYVLLEPLTDQRASDPDFDYALGLAALDTGHRAEAILAFQRALAMRPDFGEARAEIARAYALSGDVDTARREFALVSGDPTIPDPVRQRFGALVSGLDRINKPGLNVTGYGEVGAGYDSNVNAATNQAQLIIPLFSFLGPATLSGAAQRQADGFGLAEGGISLDYGFDRHSHVFASGLGSGHLNFREHAFSQGVAVATMGYSYAAANHDVVSLSGQYQRFWIGGTGYRRAVGAIAQFTHIVAPDRSIAVSAQFFDVAFPTDPLRNARRYSASVTYSTGEAVAAIQGGVEQPKNSAARYLGSDFVGLRMAIEHRLALKLSLFGSAAAEYRGYRDTDPLFLVNRHDTQIDATAGFRYRLTPHISLTPQGGFTHNGSNIAIDKFDRFTATLSMRAEF